MSESPSGKAGESGELQAVEREQSCTQPVGALSVVDLSPPVAVLSPTWFERYADHYVEVRSV